VIFGGLQPFTLTDFPGRVAAIAFAAGCNFRCPWCHNGALWRRPQDGPGEAAVLAFLGRRSARLDGLVVSGGEPTLQADLPAFLARVKAMGFQTKLDTNGSRPDMVRRVLDAGLVDCVAMDVKAPPAKYARLAGVPVEADAVEASIAAIAASGVECVFRTTWVTPLLDAADLEAIRALLPRGARHEVQPYRPELARDRALRPVAAG
jgi:pyruvate formate lyase activating enzyme